MVNLLTGPKGSGKTQQMIEQANKQAIECIFIDGILKHADISIENIPGFIDRLKKLSEECGINFYVSISAEKAELKDIDLDGCTLLN